MLSRPLCFLLTAMLVAGTGSMSGALPAAAAPRAGSNSTGAWLASELSGVSRWEKSKATSSHRHGSDDQSAQRGETPEYVDRDGNGYPDRYLPVVDAAGMSPAAWNAFESNYIPECWGPTKEWDCIPVEPADPRAALPPPPPSQALVRRWASEVVLRLELPRPVIQVGPDPQINEWKFAPVGFPLWLWTGGPATLTRTTSWLGHSFRLAATRASLSFDLGDGTLIECATATPRPKGAGDAASPDCGHVYSVAPKGGSYRITATGRWGIAWSAMGYSGILPGTVEASRVLPVGELQSVIRR